MRHCSKPSRTTYHMPRPLTTYQVAEKLRKLGLLVGRVDGDTEGADDGALLGLADGGELGTVDGIVLGASDGDTEGNELGLVVG